MSYHPALGRWMQTDPIPYVDGMNLYEAERGNPVNLLDPAGLKSEKLPPTKFIETDHFVLNGYLNIDTFFNTQEKKGIPFSTTYIIENNYLKKLKPMFGKNSEYEVPVDAGKGFAAPVDVELRSGSPWSLDDADGKPVSQWFHDYIDIHFKGTASPKEKCDYIEGKVTLTISGEAKIDGANGKQAPITKTFDFKSPKEPKNKVPVGKVSAKHEEKGDLKPGKYLLFKVESGSEVLPKNWARG